MVRPDGCQQAYFRKADQARFYWLTRNALMRLSQQTLLSTCAAPGGQRVLEIGCGEGADLYGFRESGAHLVGIDLYEQKLVFAVKHNQQARFIAANASGLPFEDNSFDLVFCKDVLHHIEAKEKAVAEMLRVCRLRGRVVVIEANGRNPLWRIFGTLIPAERGVRSSSLEGLSRLFKAHETGSQKVAGEFLYIPLPAVFLAHYKFGWQNLGNKKGFLKLCAALSACAKKCLPKELYPYIMVSMIKT